MKARALYHQQIMDDGRIVHAIDHDGGGFVVSSEAAGVALQNFLNAATLTDISLLNQHMLFLYFNIMQEIASLPLELQDDPDAADDLRPSG
jgi:hypothetical protein